METLCHSNIINFRDIYKVSICRLRGIDNKFKQIGTTRYKCDLMIMLLSSGPVHPYQLDETFSNFRGVWCTFFSFILFLIDIPVRKQ